MLYRRDTHVAQLEPAGDSLRVPRHTSERRSPPVAARYLLPLSLQSWVTNAENRWRAHERASVGDTGEWALYAKFTPIYVLRLKKKKKNRSSPEEHLKFHKNDSFSARVSSLIAEIRSPFTTKNISPEYMTEEGESMFRENQIKTRINECRRKEFLNSLCLSAICNRPQRHRALGLCTNMSQYT